MEIKVEDANILFSEGAAPRFHDKGEPKPARHQFLLEFDDESAVSFSTQIYGGIWCFLEGGLDNPYYKAAREKPSPLNSAFDEAYFNHMMSPMDVQKLSLKAFLATGQRIPGLGNGVLQDILFNAKLHPRKQIHTLTGKEKEALFNSVKRTLSEMAARGGRNTELDFFGHPGGYGTVLCKNTVNKPCPVCGKTIEKEAYLGGSVYYCGTCQIL